MRIVALAAALFFASAPGSVVATPLNLPEVALEPLAWSDLDGWEADDHAAAFRTFLASCRAVVRRITPGRAAMPVGPALQAVCERALGRPALAGGQARRFFETAFRPVRIARLGEEQGLITGYYEPVVDGSPVPTEEFRFPLRRRPDELVRADPPPPAGSGRPVWGVPRGGRLEPYFSRAEIEDGALDGRGLELVWLRDPVDAFFIHVQGSTRVRLPDGRELRLNYDGQNGHRYIAIGRDLIDRGIVPREEMSLDRLRAWMAANPDAGRELRRLNPSYIFFRNADLAPDEEALGAQGIPLTAWRSIAVDRNLHVYGTPFWIEAQLPVETERAETPVRRLFIAQDTGGAILGPARADIYCGAGPLAGQIAGRFRHPGRFVMFVPAGADPVVAGRRMPLPKPRPAAPRRS